MSDSSQTPRPYEKTLYAGWGDMDFNAHMRNTAYLDKAADVRMMFFAENGFPASEFARLRIGPVVMRDEIEYYREVGLMEELHVVLVLAGFAQDGSRFMVRNEFYLLNRALAARVTSLAGWLDLSARRLVPPPPALLAAISRLT